MSKVYALSGMRVGYLCGDSTVISMLNRRSRPWAVGLTGQIAAVRALDASNYYQECYRITRSYREELHTALQALGWSVIPGSANFLLCHLPNSGIGATELVQNCRQKGLYIREWAVDHSGEETAIRIAVKDGKTNKSMVGILKDVLYAYALRSEVRKEVNHSGN